MEVLQRVFGYASFRGPQEAIVRHVIAGGSGLVLMPTGGGKSLCYQVPALCRPGLAVVISPLIALMKDQVDALEAIGYPAAAIHSGLSQDERLQEAGVMRVLGASKKQLRLAQATEFGSLGLLAGTVAALAASTIAGLITVQVFNLPWRFETTLLLYGIVGGTLLALVTGLWATRRVTEAPPNETLRTL